MRRIVLDLEADGLLMTATTVWCVVVHDLDTGEFLELIVDEDSVQILNDIFSESELIVGHNILMYDLPLLNRLYGITYDPNKVYDTVLASRLLLPDRDGGHSLMAWGRRIGAPKMEFSDFSEFSLRMMEYCKQDVKVSADLFRTLSSEISKSTPSLILEHQFADIITKQILAGFNFDLDKAIKLYDELKQEYLIIYNEVLGLMPKIRDNTHYKSVVSKGALLSEDSESYTYLAGKAVRTREFSYQDPNPSSRQQLASWMISLGWKPSDRTPTGQPEVNEKSLLSFNHPVANKLTKLFRLLKQTGMISDGRSSWIKSVNPNTGRIHGDVITNGANTGRCTHSNPNVAQADRKDKRMRELWIPRSNWKLVGCDASSLELRVLGHYLAYYDDGEFARAVVEGDIHTHNQNVFKLNKRDSAKTMIYALIYGAGNRKLGTVSAADSGSSNISEPQLHQMGKKLRDRVIDSFHGYEELDKEVKKMFNSRGFLVGLDGRPLHPRKEYSALNLLIQSGGAIIMKKSLINSLDLYSEMGYSLGIDYNYVGNIHDEVQIECREEIAQEIGALFVKSIEKTVHDFNLKCQMTGEYKIGNNWAETH